MIDIHNLTITHKQKELVGIHFRIDSSLALVGQSGSGKSLTLKALLGMLPQDMQLHLDMQADFVLKAGESIAFVPQNPFTALSPLTKIKKQFFVSNARVAELFGELGLDIALMERFSPELSGGQLQRIVIAMALSKKPKLLLLDEPTTALDPQMRITIIELLKKLQKLEGFKMLFVTHDIVSARNLCEDICIIRYGKVVESGKMEFVLQNPQDEYTKTLIEANFVNRAYRK
jgi:peptide/nickel transport system ATP-binding protein